MKLFTSLVIFAVSITHASTNLTTDTVPNIGVDMETNTAAVADLIINAGQLSGFNDDGSAITNVNDLLRPMVQSIMVNNEVDAGEVEVAGDVVIGGVFYGDGSGLTNLNPEALNSSLGKINVSVLPASGVWDAGGLTINNVVLSGDGSGITNIPLTAMPGLGSAATNSTDSFVSSESVNLPDGVAGLNANGQLSPDMIPDLFVIFKGGHRE